MRILKNELVNTIVRQTNKNVEYIILFSFLEDLIPVAIEFYRSSNIELKLASLRLFHGLSRSVQQLHTTFNDTICDILLDAIQSNHLAIVKTASAVICNSLLDFSICATVRQIDLFTFSLSLIRFVCFFKRLLSGGILDILLSFLTHTDHDLVINSIWAFRNLSYKSSTDVKQDILERKKKENYRFFSVISLLGLTIDRIYSLLQTTDDEQLLVCLLQLIRNCLQEKDIKTCLPILDSDRLLSTLEIISEKKYTDEVHREANLLIDYINSINNPVRKKL